jgi:hypothetical protein
MLAGSYATLSHALNPLNWNYAETLATAVKNDFGGPLPRKNPPQVSVLEAESFQRWHDSTNFPEKVDVLKSS